VKEKREKGAHPEKRVKWNSVLKASKLRGKEEASKRRERGRKGELLFPSPKTKKEKTLSFSGKRERKGEKKLSDIFTMWRKKREGKESPPTSNSRGKGKGKAK